MISIDKLGFGTSKDLSRVTGGEGKVYERTIEFGRTVINIENIGSLVLIDEKRNHALTIVAIIIGLFGFSVFSLSSLFGIVVLAIGLALGAWNILKKMEVYLSIGTCDGKSTIIVSKNRLFLKKVRTLIRKKIDTKSKSSATINIENSAIAIGDSSHAVSKN